ncbi:tigger transposable element-derived protein 6 [Plakobranchus ocellatus]|uniref:Tigger transposable element-derived protein 6 n=1 Tax=Plakobranchus ocellatus TaxID=259542 RepID=A0AAV3YW42_9GAST|nr:tigger transposable element-derived protein 6 [Plakobranchus ocellatus]
MKSRQSRCHLVYNAVVIDSQSLSLLITDCRQPHRCSSLLLFEMSTPSKKRKVLTIDVKLQILADVDKKAMTKKEIAAQYDIPHNSLSTLLKNRDKIENNSHEPQRKKPRLATNAAIDEAVLTWFKQTRAINTPTSGPIICEQARIIADKLGVAGFQASNGWLEKFKQRHGIVFKVACGESASVDTTVVEDWKKATLDKLLSEYSSSDIFNADETGLFFRCLPNKTHAFKGEACHGGKQAKDRLTMLVGTNATGTEKLPLLVIGKSANPRCFKNVKSLPVEYISNSKAWMTSSIFETWIRKLDRKYLLQGRSIVMVLDNCPAHPRIKDLKAISFSHLIPPATHSPATKALSMLSSTATEQ